MADFQAWRSLGNQIFKDVKSHGKWKYAMKSDILAPT